MTTKTATNGQRCRFCKQRGVHETRKGKLKPDPTHPDNRAYDEQTVWYKCKSCGAKTTGIRCPNLLADIFSI